MDHLAKETRVTKGEMEENGMQEAIPVEENEARKVQHCAQAANRILDDFAGQRDLGAAEYERKRRRKPTS
jgi:hypothetical protein